MPAPPPLDLVQAFVNTEIPEWAVDELASPEALGRWLEGRGLAEPGTTAGPEAFVLARALRDAIRALALANTLGKPLVPTDRRAADAVLGALPLVAVTRAEGGLRVAAAGHGAIHALARIVATLHEAERDGSWARLKACRKESCGWLFYDQSRNRSSSWCSMTVCGNRTKTAAYRRRRAGRE